MRYRGVLYISAILALALLLTLLLSTMIKWDESQVVIAAAWIAGFFFVVINLCYVFVITICSRFIGTRPLPEADIDHEPRTAILYIVKNENIKDLQYKMEQSLTGNCSANIDLWLISNSDQAKFMDDERCMISRLQDKFRTESVHLYRPSNNPSGRKHIAIQQWNISHEDYPYIIVCDADTVLYPGTVVKLLAKAEHPDNRDIMVFQGEVEIGGSITRFARFFEPANNLVGRAFRRVNAFIFGRSPYYGHNALIRTKEFGKLRIPNHVLSHDLWETVAIDAAGQKVALCDDVLTQEMFPANFLDHRARSRRWILGTIEATPLLLTRKLSLGTRFYVALPLYMYLVPPVFLFWILLGLFAHNSVSGQPLIVSQPLLIGGATGLDVEMGGMCIATLTVAWFYQLSFCRRLKDVLLILREILTGTAVVINNILYYTWYVLASPWLPKVWRPMKKQCLDEVSFRLCFIQMLPSTVVGLVLLSIGAFVSPMWTALASPILAGFLLGSVTVYWTSKVVSTPR